MNATQRVPLATVSGEETPDQVGKQELESRLQAVAAPAKAGTPTLSLLSAGLDRRRFLSLLGASLGLAGLSGCFSRPRELILPYVNQPEGDTPGNPLYFATAMPLAGYGSGLLIKSMTGRPVKAEGNPRHPTGRRPAGQPHPEEGATDFGGFGPTDVFAQASLYSLYDPDRSQSVVNVGTIRSWDAFVQEVQARLRPDPAANINRNTRIRILTETVTSPSLHWQIQRLLHRFPQARWHVYEPAGQANVLVGSDHRAVRYDFTKADVVVALDADFLACGPGSVRYARDFSSRRRAGVAESEFNRLYVFESMPTVTGTRADHRRPVRAEQILPLARALAAALGVQNLPSGGNGPAVVPQHWMDALVQDLNGAHGRSIVVAGSGQPPLVHALVRAINARLGNIGETVNFTQPVEFLPALSTGSVESSHAAHPLEENGLASLRQLVDDMGRDTPVIDMLIILGGNPVDTAPADFQFRDKLLGLAEKELPQSGTPARHPLLIHLSPYRDETSDVCHWHVPEAHFLESWSDVRAFDGTVSIIQPLIAPLFGGKTAQEVLDVVQEYPQGSAYDIVRTYWGRVFTRAGGADGNLVSHFQLPVEFGEQEEQARANIAPGFEDWWRRALHDGLIEHTQAPVAQVPAVSSWPQAPAVANGDLEIVFKTDPTIFDGRFANNGWLQELPKPISKLTWDNVAYMSPATAIRLGLAPAGQAEHAHEKVVTLQYQGRSVDAPVLVQPGHADDSITVHLGYGRTRGGNVAAGAGFNAYALRSSSTPWFGKGVALQNANRTQPLAFRQRHFHMEGRDLVRLGTVQHDLHPVHIPEDARPDFEFPTLYARDLHPPQSDKRWGMAIDLSACTGCGACIVACQSENNIPVVGKGQVIAEREMHWLRVDTFYHGPAENPEIYNQPVPCMQCENAPCELVCPVEATQHSEDGLNDMVYNRCVGTRYCSNNCPYKVRRFNFLQYADIHTDPLRLMNNPEVTIRSRGVMEKCTYCVQRIRRGEVAAAREDRPLHDGEIMTACQGACPAGAITFGDLAQSQSRVSALRGNALTYGLLNDLNTRPRTSYLAAQRNPNADLLRHEEGH